MYRGVGTGPSRTREGSYAAGKKEGHWILRFRSTDMVRVVEGTYVDDLGKQEPSHQ